MTLMLRGKTLDARKAKSLGLIDAVTQERHVRNAVKAAVSGKLESRRPGLKSAILNTAPVRRFAARRMRARRRKGASRSVSGALCFDRFIGAPWWQPRGDDGG